MACRRLLLPIIFTTSLLMTAANASAAAAPTVEGLQSGWDVANYQLKDKEKAQAFERLQADADLFTKEHPQVVEGWIWSGIIKSTYAGVKGGFGALGLAKSARKDLEAALKIDAQAMHGSAYTSLGALYFKVPGWPVGFGSDKKAQQMLQKGLDIDPDGSDSNFFFAEFLRDQGKFDEARTYYVKAKQAAPRTGRPVANQGRAQEIDAALNVLNVR